MGPPMVLEFGSRSGSWFSLVFFALVFAVVGWALSRALVRRARDQQKTLARLLGLAIFLGPVTSVYVSMLSGFYRAEVKGSTVSLHYLLPRVTTEIPIAQAAARIAPAYKNRARLIISAGGREFESAPWPRDSVKDSLARLNTALASAP